MSESWRRRVAITFACWLVTFGVMAAFDLGPRPVLLAGIAAVLAAALCLILDTSDITAPAAWGSPHEAEQTRGGTDVRLRTLQRQLLTDSALDDGGTLHQLLVDLIDDRLSAEHGIDRDLEPERAAAVLEPALLAFVTSPPSTKQIRDPRFLSPIVAHIESL